MRAARLEAGLGHCHVLLHSRFWFEAVGSLAQGCEAVLTSSLQMWP